MKWNQSFDSGLQEKKRMSRINCILEKDYFFFYLECECTDWVHMDVL